MEPEESPMSVAKAIARAWTDAEYKAKLMSDPHAALTEVGVDVPAGTTVKVMENTAETTHVVLPVAPNNAGEMSIDELEKVAGGATTQVGGFDPLGTTTDGTADPSSGIGSVTGKRM